MLVTSSHIVSLLFHALFLSMQSLPNHKKGFVRLRKKIGFLETNYIIQTGFPPYIKGKLYTTEHLCVQFISNFYRNRFTQ